MSLKQNIIANYLSQIYTTVVVLLVVPAYLRYMGPESYGLVGIFGMLQGWLQLLDMGLSSTLSRQVACYRAGSLSEELMNMFVRTLVAVFVVIAFGTAAFFYFSSHWVATSWLHANSVAPELLAKCVILMGIAAALRWASELYRSIISGWEEMVWLSVYNIITATLRYVGALIVIIFIGVDLLTFFVYQLLISILEFSLLLYKAGRLIPAVWSIPIVKLESLQNMWRFTGMLAVCTVIWVLACQTDKLILSKILTLTDYGYFTVAMLVANGVIMVSSPISAALLPRLTYLFSQSDVNEFEKLYRKATQWVSVIVWPIAGVVAFFAEPLLVAWTNNVSVAHHAAPILFWYALGNALVGISSFQFYMQYAHGNLRLHLIANIIFILLLIPAVMWASFKFGAVGAARIWFAENVVSLLVWSWVVHVRFSPGLHWRWLKRDVLPIALTTLLVTWVSSFMITLSDNRFILIGQLLLLGTISLIASALSSADVQLKLRIFLLKLRI